MLLLLVATVLSILTHTFLTQFCSCFIPTLHAVAYMQLQSSHIHFPGDLPYRNIPLASIVAQIISGYRLPQPEHASDKV